MSPRTWDVQNTFWELKLHIKKHNVLLFQRKYAPDLPQETELFGCKSANTPMEANVNLWFDDNHTLSIGRYKRLIKKLIYLTITRPDITFAVGVLSRFMHQHRDTHWLVAIRILTYIKSCPVKSLVYKKHEHVRISGYSDLTYASDRGDRRFTTRYYTFVGEHLVTWRSKKQDIVPRSSAKAEYRAMTHTACEIVWLKNLLMELDFRQFGLMPIHYNNQSAIYIVRIMYSMKGPNILRLTVILSEMLGPKRWLLFSSHLQSS